MRIKIFEELLPLETFFETIINSLKSQYKISNNSQIFENSFLIIAIDPKNYAFVIRGSTDNSKNRIILLIVALDIKSLLIVLNLKDNTKIIENHLYNLIINDAKEGVLNPFKIIKINGMAKSKYKKKIMMVEGKVLNQILQVIYKKFNYRDNLIKFPFSIFNYDLNWELWVEVYESYLNEIESAITKYSKNSMKVYKYYDFAGSKEILPRIIDLIVIENAREIKGSINISEIKDQEKKNKELDIKTKTNNNFKKSIKNIFFFYAHKKLKPIRLINVLKLTQEIIKFVKIFNKENLKKDWEIKPIVIFLSLYGYEERIGKYLSEHLHHDYKNFIPMFVVPPIKNEIWHNIRTNNFLEQEEIDAKNRAKRYIKLHMRNSKNYAFIKHNIEEVKENYNEILEREKEAKKNFEFTKKWSKILNIDKSNELLNTLDNKNKFKEEIKKIKILSE
ncbi:MAG: hypothetical protein ACFFAN_00725 [Promethearchaeota archaeon]